MDATGIGPLSTLGGPPMQPERGEPAPGDKITLQRYLQLKVVGVRVSPEQFVMLSKVQLIRGWAEQAGSSHEDWKLDPALDLVLNSGIFIGGLHAAFAKLKVTTETVIHVADQFLSEYYATAAPFDA